MLAEKNQNEESVRIIYILTVLNYLVFERRERIRKELCNERRESSSDAAFICKFVIIDGC